MRDTPREGEALSGECRRDLTAKAHSLEPGINVGAKGLTDAVVAQVRQALSRHELVKVRIRVDSVDEVDAAGKDLARRVPCHLVKRVGKVVILYAPKAGSS
jgi:RNA-binding protein